MRLKSIQLIGFRAFARATFINLDADCVVVSGANGQGKTSLLDGIFWALTGTVKRLGEDSSLISLYSETGTASVVLTLSTEAGDLEITRKIAGDKTTLTCRLGGTGVSVPQLREHFGSIVIERPELADGAALASAMSRSLYLQQDSIKDFVNADTDDLRFQVTAELCGLGRITELQNALQQERKGWTQASRQFEAAVSERRRHHAELKQRADSLAAGSPDLATVQSDWVAWWKRVSALVPAVAGEIPDISSASSGTSLERVIQELELARASCDRDVVRLKEANELTSALGKLGAAPELALLQEGLSKAEAEEATARNALEAAERENAAREQLILTGQARRQERRMLAELAIRHLGDSCPVCNQEIDQELTKAHLQSLLGSAAQESVPLTDLQPLIQKLAELSRARLDGAATLSSARRLVEKRRELETNLERLSSALEVDGRNSSSERGEVFASRLDAVVGRAAQLTAARSEAERLLLVRARSNELAQRREVLAQIKTAEAQLRRAEHDLQLRESAGRAAAGILEKLREASLGIVASELARIEPLFQRIWAGIDPHPSLRAVNLVSKLSYGKGRLSLRLADSFGNVETNEPGAILSSSQLNALAVTLFLTLNLGTQGLPLPLTVLDDPFQSLDPINLLGLVDLMRRVAGNRQLVVTTHETRFAQLLERKLRPTEQARTTKMITFEGWNSGTPQPLERQIVADPTPYRIVAVA